MCTFPRPEASVIPTQTPRRGRVLPGGGCPLGTPSPCEAACFGAGDDARLAHRKRRPWGRCSAAGASGGAGARGCKVLQPVTGAQEGAAGVSICFRMFPSCFHLRPRPARAATLGRVAQKQGLPLRPAQGLRALRERGEEAKPVRYSFDLGRLCSVLFESVQPAASK